MNTRRIIQSLFLFLSVFSGVRFVIYLSEIQSGSADAAKPGGVEGFLPISALMALKQLIFTGMYDFVHPAGLTLFITFLFISIIFKRSFCGYICPVGFFSEMVSLIGFNRRASRKLNLLFGMPKYLLFIFFFYIIAVNMPLSSIEKFLNAPYNIIADAKMLDFFLKPTVTTLVFLLFMILATLVFRGVWCRYLCPYGVLHSILGFLSPFSVRRDADACTKCMKCTTVCPAGINVHAQGRVNHPDCIGCYDCVNVRSNPDCLSIGRWDISVKRVGYVIVIVFILAVAAAMVSGLWRTNITNSEYLFWYEKKEMLSH